MQRMNYHTHNNFCDGQGDMAEYVEVALARGMTALGFSSHAPLPIHASWTLSRENLPLYLAEIKRLQQYWSLKIQIYAGLEIDYIPGSPSPGDICRQIPGLDYCIGSVHATAGLDVNPEYICVDSTHENFLWLVNNVHGSVEDLCEAYYTRVAELLRLGEFSFLGHFDLVKKFNQNGDFFLETAPWYKRLVIQTLDILASAGIIMEVNSGGISRHVINEVYPSPWILQLAAERHIPVMINSDAHQPQHIDFYFDESLQLLRETGYREISALLDNRWVSIPIFNA